MRVLAGRGAWLNLGDRLYGFAASYREIAALHFGAFESLGLREGQSGGCEDCEASGDRQTFQVDHETPYTKRAGLLRAFASSWQHVSFSFLVTRPGLALANVCG